MIGLLVVEQPISEDERFAASPGIEVSFHILRIFIETIPVIGIEFGPFDPFADLDGGGGDGGFAILEAPAVAGVGGIGVFIHCFFAVADLSLGIEAEAIHIAVGIFFL